MQNLLILALVLVALPAALVAIVPRRWMTRAMLLWLVSPVALYVVVIATELLTGPPSENALRNALHGLLLLGSLLAIPWLIACAIGFLVGLWLRRLRRSPAVVAAAPVQQRPAAWIAPGATRPAGEVRSQVSPDGTIRVDLDTVEWANALWVASPRVTEVATGRILLDLWGTDWDASVAFPDAGCIRLGLRRYRTGGSVTVALDPRGCLFREVVAPGRPAPPPAPLSTLRGWLDAWVPVDAWAALPTVAPAPRPWAAWRSALLILLGAAAAIAGGTWATLRFAPPTGQHLIDQKPMPVPPGFGR